MKWKTVHRWVRRVWITFGVTVTALMVWNVQAHGVPASMVESDTHPRDVDLSGATWPVMKILGSADCVASIRNARANASRLPAGAQWIELAGANHRQFGYYGWQLGDCDAAISREDQHRQTIDAIVAFVRAVAG